MDKNVFAISIAVLLLCVIYGAFYYTILHKKNKYWKVVEVITIIVTIVDIPFIISERYKANTGYITPWGASDVLSFYGSLLAFIGTVSLGWLAYGQSKRANEINKRLVVLEASKEIPVFNMIGDDFRMQLDKNPSNYILRFRLYLYSGEAYTAYLEPYQFAYSDKKCDTYIQSVVYMNNVENVQMAPLKAEICTIGNLWKELKLSIDGSIGEPLLKSLKLANTMHFQFNIVYLKRNNEKRKRMINLFYVITYDETKNELVFTYKDFFICKEIQEEK